MWMTRENGDSFLQYTPEDTCFILAQSGLRQFWQSPRTAFHFRIDCNFCECRSREQKYPTRPEFSCMHAFCMPGLHAAFFNLADSVIGVQLFALNFFRQTDWVSSFGRKQEHGRIKRSKVNPAGNICIYENIFSSRLNWISFIKTRVSYDIQ